MIEKLLQSNFKNKKLLIITTSRQFYHAKKKYYLENNPYEEYFIKDTIYPQDAAKIYQKIQEKGYLGDLPLSEKDGVHEIMRQKNYINLFSYLTYGSGFKQRVKSMTSAISKSSNKILDLFDELAIFDKADLPYYPAELISNHYAIDYKIFIEKNYASLKNEQQLLVDNIGIDANGIVLKNRLLIDEIWKKMSNQKKQETIFNILINISSFISEDDETYWRIIFESLLKEERLVNQFGLKKTEILPLFYRVKDFYKNISYYWLQLGIAEQRVNEFSKALNHLQMARQIRPNAYQIQHAIARNYLKHAYAERNKEISMTLFQTGEQMMLNLINSQEPYKEKAKNFSVHCYAYEKIRYLEKHSELIDKRTCERLKLYIDMLIPESDEYTYGLVTRFTKMLSQNDLLSLLRMKPDDMYFQSLSDHHIHLQDLEEDIVVESY